MAVTLPPGVYRRDIAQKSPPMWRSAPRPRSRRPDDRHHVEHAAKPHGRVDPYRRQRDRYRAELPAVLLQHPEADFGVTYTVRAAIEYPAGTFTRVDGSGPARPGGGARARDGELPAGACGGIPAGTKFWVKTFASWTPGNFYLSNHAASWISGDGTRRGTGLTDDTTTAATLMTTSSAGFGPSVYGRLSNPSVVLA